MRTIKRTKKFKRDYKREMKSNKHKKLEDNLFAILELLMKDKPLPSYKYDHALVGNWQDYRDCHINSDLVLIYRKPDIDTLELVRLGSHSHLGLS